MSESGMVLPYSPKPAVYASTLFSYGAYSINLRQLCMALLYSPALVVYAPTLLSYASFACPYHIVLRSVLPSKAYPARYWGSIVLRSRRT
eukprot:3313521-Rhodomonas_salina.1